MAGNGTRGGGLMGNLPTGVKLAAVALLVHSLMKHRQSEPTSAGSEAGSSGGGLGGILGSIFGHGQEQPPPASPPARTTPAGGDGGFLSGLLVGPVLGGLGDLLSGLRRQGLGQKADSWVSPGPNQPVSAAELERAFAPGELDEAARRAGTDRATLLQALSEMLPDVVDRMTPGGKLPQREEDLGNGGIGRVFGDWLGGGNRTPETRR